MTRRSDSWSMRSPSAVNPTMSAKRTVTVRRSSRRGPAARRGVPQFAQKLARSLLSVPQAGQVTATMVSRDTGGVRVTVRLFANLRTSAGRDSLELELPEGARVADALAALDHVAAGLPVVMAVNREYARAETVLREDDELALVPPVSGG